MRNSNGFTLIETLLAMSIGAVLVSTALMLYMHYARPSVKQIENVTHAQNLMMFAQSYSTFSSKGCFPLNQQKLADFSGLGDVFPSWGVSYTCSRRNLQFTLKAQTSHDAERSAPVIANVAENIFSKPVEADCRANRLNIVCTIEPKAGSFCCE